MNKTTFKELEYGYAQNINTKTRILNFFRRLFMVPVLEQVLISANNINGLRLISEKLIPNHYQYKVGSLRYATRSGINYELDLSELMDWFIYFAFKDDGRSNLYSYVKHGQTVMDIGANMGVVSFLLARIVGAKGRVISFEPDPINFERFEKNFRLNSFNNIELNKVGLGNKEGNYKMDMNNLEPGNLGSNRVLPSEIQNNYQSARDVKITTLDTWIKSNPIEHLAIIKLDIEGFEVNAIRGGIKTIEKFKPTIFTELHDAKLKEQGSSAKEYVDLLKSFGYTLIPDNGVNLNLDLTDINTDLTCIFN